MTSKAAKGRRLDEVVQLVDEQTGEAAVNIASQVLERKRAIGVSRGQVLVTQNGGRHPISDSAAPITDVDGRTQGVVWVFRDLTQERELQNRVQHAQRLDSLGLLAGGVAHDFNNLLTAMAGGIELLTLDPTLSKESRETVGIMSDAAERAIGLTSQLLTFGRRQLMHLKAVDLNEAVSQARGLLQRLLPRTLKFAQPSLPAPAACWLIPFSLNRYF
jgi:two-component system, cell cycle sensor histidine kinase and response regulator CckA